MDIEVFNAELNGEGLRVGIVQSRFNEPICTALRESCLAELARLGVSEEDVFICSVPGDSRFRWLCASWLQSMSSTR